MRGRLATPAVPAVAGGCTWTLPASQRGVQPDAALHTQGRPPGPLSSFAARAGAPWSQPTVMDGPAGPAQRRPRHRRPARPPRPRHRAHPRRRPQPRPGPKPAHWTRIDADYQTLAPACRPSSATSASARSQPPHRQHFVDQRIQPPRAERPARAGRKAAAPAGVAGQRCGNETAREWRR